MYTYIHPRRAGAGYDECMASRRCGGIIPFQLSVGNVKIIMRPDSSVGRQHLFIIKQGWGGLTTIRMWWSVPYEAWHENSSNSFHLDPQFLLLCFSTWSFHAHKGHVTAAKCARLSLLLACLCHFFWLKHSFHQVKKNKTKKKQKQLFACQTSACVKSVVGVFKNSNSNNSSMYSIHFTLWFCFCANSFGTVKRRSKARKGCKNPVFKKSR